MSNPLLEKAKTIKSNRQSSQLFTVNRDELGLFIALVDGEVTAEQAAKALGVKMSQIFGRRDSTFVKAVRLRILKMDTNGSSPD